MPSHSVIQRPSTNQERRLIERETRINAWEYGCVTMVFGILPIAMLAAFGGWLASWHSEFAVPWGRLAGFLVGLGFFSWVIVTFSRFDRGQRRRAARDAKDSMVQQVSVHQPRAVEIAPINDNEPVLAFDIGDGKLLFLQGQWLFNDAAIYGAKEPDGEYDQFLNRLPSPYSFPSTAFTVLRLPHSGRVLSIRVEGGYLAPAERVSAIRPEYEFRDSELFDGTLEAISDVLAREHQARSSSGIHKATTTRRFSALHGELATLWGVLGS